MTDQPVAALAEGAPVEDLVLAAEFAVPTRADWQRMVAKVLGDAVTTELADSPEQLLETVTADGIHIQPLYVADDAVADPGFPGEAPFIRGSLPLGHRQGWDVRQRHGHPTPSVAREQVMADLEGGATSLWLQLGDGFTQIESLPEVLTEVYLDLATVVLDAGAETVAAAETFLELVRSRGLPADQVTAVLGADPLGLAARTGAAADLSGAAALAARCARDFPAIRTFAVDALAFHDAGATDAEELGCSLAAGVAYVRAMHEAGLSGESAFAQLEFRYAATADQFATIAKLRAARRVWARVAEGCGVTGPTAGQRQHAVTSWPMFTQRDPWNNMLRATLACFGAGVGGADAVTVLPFDSALGRPDDLGRRIARNTQALLVEESHVAQVIDPAGGSWYVESLTEELAARAWAWFQEIEAAGGLEAALSSGLIAARIAASRDAHRDAIAHGRITVTGVSEFPLQGEVLLSRPAGSTPSTAVGDAAVGLPSVRWAQWHEQLRDRSDAFTAATGAAPSVTVVVLGGSRPGGAPADRARSAFASAGIVTSTATLDEISSAGAAPAVVCVCAGSDVDEAEIGAAISSLRAAGVTRVVAATAERAAGADDQISRGMDTLAFQGRTLDALGVAL